MRRALAMRSPASPKKLQAKLLTAVGEVMHIGQSRLVEFASDDAEKLSEDFLNVAMDLSTSLEKTENERRQKRTT